MFLGEPPRSQGDLCFVLFGFPVRVHPWFWIMTLLFGITGDRNPDMREMLLELVIWAAAMFVSILVHELGHAIAARRYGLSPSITLHGMGGLTSYAPGYSRRLGSLGETLISAAGPVAGFVLAALIVMPVSLAGKRVVVDWLGPLPSIGIGEIIGSMPLTLFLDYILFISVFWGMVNLLPVYPLDGGQIAREVLSGINPRDGIRLSLLLSCITAGAIAIIGLLRLQSYFVALFFGYLAYSSYATLQAYQGRRPW